MDTIKQKFFSNTSWLILQQLYSMVLSLVVGAISARYLGPSNYGLINYGASYVAFFTSISTLGFDSVIVTEIVKQPNKKSDYLGTALFLRLIASTLSFFAVSIIIFFLANGDDILIRVTIFQAFGIVLQTYQVLNYWFQTELKMKVVSVASMCAITIVNIWKIFLLVTKASVEWFALSTSINWLVCGTVVTVVFIRISKLKLSLSFSAAKYLLSLSYNYIVADIASVLYGQMDKLMLGSMLDSSTVGYYSAATTIANMWLFIPNAIISSSIPIIIEKRAENYSVYLKLLKKLLLTVTYIGIFFAISFTLFGWLAIRILYGAEYDNASIPLIILSWSSVFAILGSARSPWITGEKYYKYTKYYILFGFVVNLILNFILIQIWGVIGAATATLLSQFAVLFIGPALFKDTRSFVKIYITSFRYTKELLYSFKLYFTKIIGKFSK